MDHVVTTWLDLLLVIVKDIYMFVDEEKIYRFDSTRSPVWQLDHVKYGDWSSTGIYTKFMEFPISKVNQDEHRTKSHFVQLRLFVEFVSRMYKTMGQYIFMLLLLNMAIPLILNNVHLMKHNISSGKVNAWININAKFTKQRKIYSRAIQNKMSTIKKFVA
jgi:hypothetical protein